MPAMLLLCLPHHVFKRAQPVHHPVTVEHVAVVGVTANKPVTCLVIAVADQDGAVLRYASSSRAADTLVSKAS